MVLMMVVISNVVTYRWTTYHDECAAIEHDFAKYNQYLDFEWKSTHDLGIEEINKQYRLFQIKKAIEDANAHATPLVPPESKRFF